jgi:hypothetical protein
MAYIPGFQDALQRSSSISHAPKLPSSLDFLGSTLASYPLTVRQYSLGPPDVSEDEGIYKITGHRCEAHED